MNHIAWDYEAEATPPCYHIYDVSEHDLEALLGLEGGDAPTFGIVAPKSDAMSKAVDDYVKAFDALVDAALAARGITPPA